MSNQMKNSEISENVEHALPFETSEVAVVPENALVATQNSNEVVLQSQLMRQVPRYGTLVWRHKKSGKTLLSAPPPEHSHLYAQDYDFFLHPFESGVIDFKVDLRGAGFANVGADLKKDKALFEQEIFIIPQYFQELGIDKDLDRYKLFLSLDDKGKKKEPNRNLVWWFFKAVKCWEHEFTGDVSFETPTIDKESWFETFKVEPKLYNMLVKTFSYGTFFSIQNEAKTQSENYWNCIFHISLKPEEKKDDVNKIAAKYVKKVPPYLKDAICDYRADLGKKYDESGNFVADYKIKQPLCLSIFAELLALNVPDFDSENGTIPENLRPFMNEFLGNALDRGLYEELCIEVTKRRKKYSEAGLL